MIKKISIAYINLIFLILPISILVGPSVSLINIILINFSFVFYLIYKRKFLNLNDPIIKLFIFLYIYLIFNSFVAEDFHLSFNRNFGFIRWIVFFVAFNYFYPKLFFKKIFFVWTILIFILVIDVYFEFFVGFNLVGYQSQFGNRIVSFFKDEPIIGGFLGSFFLIVIGFLLQNFVGISKKKLLIIFVISLIIFISILLTGERSNTLKSLFAIIIFYFIINKPEFKKKIIYLIALISLALITISSSHYLKTRYLHQLFNQNNNNQNFAYNFFNKSVFMNYEDHIYYKIYRSGFLVFKDSAYFGVGNKNYRLKSCEKAFKFNDKRYICTTHPHQIYIELLSEHGIFGTLIITITFLIFIFKNFNLIKRDQNYIQIGSFVFLITFFIPLLPSGSFFSDYNLTLFMINLSIMYASNPNTNIFTNKKKN